MLFYNNFKTGTGDRPTDRPTDYISRAMDIQWNTHTLIHRLPDASEQDEQRLIAMGLAPLTEQCERLDDSSDETSDAPPSLQGHSVIMYYNIIHGSGWASIAINLPLTTVLRMIEAPLRRSEKESLAHQRQIRDHVQQSGDAVTLIIYDWPEGNPVTSHIVKQALTYRSE